MLFGRHEFYYIVVVHFCFRLTRFLYLSINFLMKTTNIAHINAIKGNLKISTLQTKHIQWIGYLDVE